ncbi:MAG: hypothetical protein DRJ51_04170 [Thermoprotei archaeon]|nr:MAG: hypothetical protein DRJ51_04170 [Thermoprotei archaeon]
MIQREYKQFLPEIRANIALDEVEIKAILAYLNSALTWLFIEGRLGAAASKGPIVLHADLLEACFCSILRILDVRMLRSLLSYSMILRVELDS